jgi:hypothetical protein
MFIRVGGGGRHGSPYRLSYRLAEFFQIFWGKRSAELDRSCPTYYTSIDTISAKDVPWGSHRCISSHEVIPSKALELQSVPFRCGVPCTTVQCVTLIHHHCCVSTTACFSSSSVRFRSVQLEEKWSRRR